MNLESAKNRVQIISGLSARILRHCDFLGAAANVVHDVETIQRQCAALALDLEEPRAVNKDTGTLSGNRRE